MYVSTPNVLTLAPEGAEKSGNPWHVKEYRPEEFHALCAAHFSSVELYGLFHARKLAVHEFAIKKLRWDDVHQGLRITKPFYDWFTPAISVRGLHAHGRPAAGARAGLRGRLPTMTASSGRLAIVLHSHMPYVEGFGTWPFGEEWLFEAAATVYVPLLEVLESRAAPLTLSVTPVLADQLAAPGVHERLLSFLRDLRVTTHALDAEGCRAGGEPALADAGGARRRRLRARRRRVSTRSAPAAWPAAWRATRRGRRSATHAVLPLLATDAGVRLQLRAGIEAHRARGAAAGAPPWRGGLWLPECAHAPWLHPLLEEAGVHATCVDLTDVLPDALTPLATSDGPLLVPIDRTVDRVGVERRRLPGRRRLPRLAPQDRPPPPSVGQRRRRL